MTHPQSLAFLIHMPEMLNHYGCVMDLLPPGSFDLLLCGDAVGDPALPDLARRWSAPIRLASDILRSGDRYAHLVSNHPFRDGDPPLIKEVAHRNVRFMYAAGKSGWNLRPWNKAYDLILAFGPFHAYAFAEITPAVILQIGYPRFDRFFTQPVDRGELLARYGCDPAKPTLVWLPTWQGLSSMDLYGEEVSALMASHNVVVKLHPLSAGSEPDRVARLQQLPFTRLFTDASDNQPLYQLADRMLFDYGGPPFAGIYTDKPMLLLNVPGAASDHLAGPDSTDILLRNHLPSVEPGGIAGALADAETWSSQVADRRFLRGQFFAPCYGFASQVAASALMNLKHLCPVQDAPW